MILCVGKNRICVEEVGCKSGLRGAILKWVICIEDDPRKCQGEGVGSKNGYMFRRTKR